MNTFIVLSIIAVVFLVAGILVNRYTYEDGWVFLLVCIGGLAVCGLVGAGVSLINKNTRFIAIQNEYQVITEMVESYDGQDFGNIRHTTTVHGQVCGTQRTSPTWNPSDSTVKLRNGSSLARSLYNSVV